MADENFKLSDAEHKMILNIIFDNVIGNSKPEDNPVIFVLHRYLLMMHHFKVC